MIKEFNNGYFYYYYYYYYLLLLYDKQSNKQAKQAIDENKKMNFRNKEN